MEFTLLGAGAIGGASAWAALRLTVPADRRPVLANALLSAVVSGILAGRVWAMVAAGTNPLTHPADLLIVRGGVDTLGASLGALIALAVTLRTDLTRLDLAAPAALAGLAGWHAGCVVRGTCLGTATGLPWGVTAPGSVVARHPVEVYAALLLVVAAVIVARRVGMRPLLRTGTALALASLARGATEPLRLSLSGSTLWVYAFGVMAGAGIAVAAWRRRTPV